MANFALQQLLSLCFPMTDDQKRPDLLLGPYMTQREREQLGKEVLPTTKKGGVIHLSGRNFWSVYLLLF